MSGNCDPGQEFVAGYVKRDGTRVSGYCRDAHAHITPHDRMVDRRNGKMARGSTWHDRR